MHIPYAFGIADDPDTEGFHNIIVNLLQLVLVDAPVLLPHEFPQLEPKIPLEVDAFINHYVQIPIISNAVIICPSP